MKVDRTRNLNAPDEISKYMSVDGRKEAVVLTTDKGYVVELYERSRYIRTIDVSTHSLTYAEDTAENWVLGVIN